MKIDLQLAKLGCLKNLGILFPLKNLPFGVPPRSRFPIPFLFDTSFWVQSRWPRADRPSIGKVMGPQKLGDFFPLKNLPFGVSQRGRLPIPFLLCTSSGDQGRWPREDRPSIGKVTAPQKFGGFYSPKKLPLGMTAESCRRQRIFPVCRAELIGFDPVRKLFSVLEILIVVENGLFLGLSKIQKFISDTTQVRIFLFSNMTCPPSPSCESLRKFFAKLPMGGSRG